MKVPTTNVMTLCPTSSTGWARSSASSETSKKRNSSSLSVTPVSLSVGFMRTSLPNFWGQVVLLSQKSLSCRRRARRASAREAVPPYWPATRRGSSRRRRMLGAGGRLGGSHMGLRGARARAGTDLFVRIRNTHTDKLEIVAWPAPGSPDRLRVGRATFRGYLPRAAGI